jgi:hypothetical protein
MITQTETTQTDKEIAQALHARAQAQFAAEEEGRQFVERILQSAPEMSLMRLLYTVKIQCDKQPNELKFHFAWGIQRAIQRLFTF